jgi:hypothetical protein
MRKSIGRHAVGLAALLCACLPWPGMASAQTYPDRPVKIIVPIGPAGSYDIVGRLLADQLTRRLGQTVVVENRPGGGAVIGTQAVATAAPDGYMLLIGGPRQHDLQRRPVQEAAVRSARGFHPGRDRLQHLLHHGRLEEPALLHPEGDHRGGAQESRWPESRARRHRQRAAHLQRRLPRSSPGRSSWKSPIAAQPPRSPTSWPAASTCSSIRRPRRCLTSRAGR